MVNVKIIGITGGICAGKSTICKELQSYGVKFIDSDKYGREIYEKGTIQYQQIVQYFGNSILNSDGSINRQLLGNRVFGLQNIEHLKFLDQIVTPYIVQKISEKIQNIFENATNDTIIVQESAIMFEKNLTEIFDEIWVSFIDPEIAVNRIISRDNFNQQQAIQRIKSQLDNDSRLQVIEKLRKQNKIIKIIHNNTTKLELKRQIQDLFIQFVAKNQLQINLNFPKL